MAQRLGGAPVRPQPGQRGRVVRAEAQQVSGHRDQRLQVERTGQAAADPGDGEVVAARHGGAQLIGEDAGAGRTEAAPVRRRWRDQHMEEIFRQAVEVELPGDHPCPGGGLFERGDGGRRAGDGQTMMQPVGVGEPQRCRLVPARPGASLRFRAPPARCLPRAGDPCARGRRDIGDRDVGIRRRRRSDPAVVAAATSWGSVGGGDGGPGRRTAGDDWLCSQSSSASAAARVLAAARVMPASRGCGVSGAGCGGRRCGGPRRCPAGGARHCPSGRPCGTPGRTAWPMPAASRAAPAPGNRPDARRGGTTRTRGGRPVRSSPGRVSSSPLVGEAELLDLEADQRGAAQSGTPQAGAGQQQQGAVAQPGEVARAGRGHPRQLGRPRRWRATGRGGAAGVAQQRGDRRIAGRRDQPVLAVAVRRSRRRGGPARRRSGWARRRRESAPRWRDRPAARPSRSASHQVAKACQSAR